MYRYVQSEFRKFDKPETGNLIHNVRFVRLSAILLAGPALNAVLGWWWAHPAAPLIMVPVITEEGFDGIKARTCC